MAGRKPIDDDRKRKAVTMNVSNKDLKILDNFIRKNGLSSRSYFLYRVVYGYINGNYVKKSNDIAIPNEYDYIQQEFCKKSLKDKEFLDKHIEIERILNTLNVEDLIILHSIFLDKEKKERLISMIRDSRSLYPEVE